MTIPFLPPLSALGAIQRVLLVTLLTPAVLLALTAAVPALIVLPFLPGGTDRAIALLTAHTAYLTALLTGSRTLPPNTARLPRGS
ncbi:dTMP kinase [Streptomyces glycanivorans]|uniref:dTMP kinase n=1 Tax=Streptomyces glycanivorans TaxID=3033808 RepID=A0ABY9J7X9_9ACTN|nr:dTMP kinase [Streptomyces sp. Alt3]WLQ62071.1 dTMP kinase [Streptomyces sp. Alt3]